MNLNHALIINPEGFTKGTKEYEERIEYIAKVKELLESESYRNLIMVFIYHYLNEYPEERWDPVWLLATEYLDDYWESKLIKVMKYNYPHIFNLSPFELFNIYFTRVITFFKTHVQNQMTN